MKLDSGDEQALSGIFLRAWSSEIKDTQRRPATKEEAAAWMDAAEKKILAALKRCRREHLKDYVKLR